MKRPVAYTRPAGGPADIKDLTQTAEYVGSREHKIGQWWGGQGSAPASDGVLKRPKKQLTTVCPLHTKKDRAEATGWIREALSTGRFLFVEGDKRFPKHVWREDAGSGGWIGRCVNSVQGAYKGWPAEAGEIATLERKKRQKHEV